MGIKCQRTEDRGQMTRLRRRTRPRARPRNQNFLGDEGRVRRRGRNPYSVSAGGT